MKKINIATVFSGIGAIEHALQRLQIDHHIVFACDIDKYCKQTYFANYKINENQWYNDIKVLDGNKYKNKIDLFVGGSPCQSFSMVGKRKGLEDDRGNLFFEFARLVDEIKPKIFIFENVKGLLSHNSGKTWETIEETIKGLGYTYYKQVLNSRDYGIPQNRERLFVIGFLEEQSFEFPKPIPLEITMQNLLVDNPEVKYFLPEKGIKFVSDNKNLNKKYTQIDGKIALCQKANQQFNWHGDFVMDKYYLSEKVKNYVLSGGTRDFYSKPAIDLSIARPLLSTMAKMHRAGVDNYITRGDKLRKLTPRECLRLMGFSDEFKIVVSDTQAYKQTGNSIVVDVLVNLLKSIYGK
ncbi:DNA cytosine methyltransferase [Candidatus Tisiphia endosymbiont of Ptychoptera albimana]|uniref:DNA cytosine methyltransferase n=1 Tax=Candidatus Tisiphia endosymbiont of Ptychoptera albimana TaxID=3066260 RepID=UPI00312CB616